jgi:hypothetical protein
MEKSENDGFPRRCTPVEELDLYRVALDVCDDLRLSGIPVTFGGSSFDGLPTGEGGALVFCVAEIGDSHGVYVRWGQKSELTRRLVQSGGPDPRALAIGSAVLQGMTDVLQAVLAAAGWVVDAEDTGVYESALRIFRR